MKSLALASAITTGLILVGVQTARWFTTPVATAWSSGPTIEHLESLSELVCLRVHVSDVLVGENDTFRGSWLIKGDAVLAIDLRQAKIVECDQAHRRARIRLPSPTVQSPRVDHERTKTWSVEKTTWIPWRGDPDQLRDAAMRQAQLVIQSASNSAENMILAKKSAGKIIQELYRMVGWELQVEWADAGKR